MTTFLIISGAAIWWFVGMVSARLIWRTLSNESGSFIYEWGPFARLTFFILSFTGPILAYIYGSDLVANTIEENRARKQVREAMKQERNILVIEYNKKLLAEAGLEDVTADEFDPSEAEIE